MSRVQISKFPEIWPGPGLRRAWGYESNPGREVMQLGLGAWQRIIGLSCKAGARPKTRRVLDKKKQVVGSMAKLAHVRNMNIPLTSVQNMFSICPKRYGMNAQSLAYHGWTNLSRNRFVCMAQSNIKLKTNICCVFSGPDLTHIQANPRC